MFRPAQIFVIFLGIALMVFAIPTRGEAYLGRLQDARRRPDFREVGFVYRKCYLKNTKLPKHYLDISNASLYVSLNAC